MLIASCSLDWIAKWAQGHCWWRIPPVPLRPSSSKTTCKSGAMGQEFVLVCLVRVGFVSPICSACLFENVWKLRSFPWFQGPVACPEGLFFTFHFFLTILTGGFKMFPLGDVRRQRAKPKKLQSHSECQDYQDVPSLSRYRAREEWSKPGDFTFVLTTFDDFQNCSKLLPVSAVSGDPLHCWDDRCMLRQGSMPPASGRTTYCGWMNQRWIDDELRTFPTLTDVQSFDCDVIHLHLAFSFPWRVPFFCKFFKGLRKRYLTWLVRVALCPSVLICKIRMIRAFTGACQCGRSDCCDLVLRWSRVSHWDLFSVTWNFIFLTVTQLQREVVQKNIEVVKRCKELIF